MGVMRPKGGMNVPPPVGERGLGGGLQAPSHLIRVRKFGVIAAPTLSPNLLPQGGEGLFAWPPAPDGSPAAEAG